MRLTLVRGAVRAAQISLAAVWLSNKANDLSLALWAYAERHMAHAGNLAEQARLQPVRTRRR